MCTTDFSIHNINVFIPLLLSSSSSDSKNGSQSSVKSSKENTGSASDSFFWCDLCGRLVVLRGGWAPGFNGYLWGATWVMWTWLTWAGGWSFHPRVETAEKEAECKIRTNRDFVKGLKYSFHKDKKQLNKCFPFFSRIFAKA